VVRPGRAPCDARAALSWDFDALRGRVPSRRDGHEFRRPARRFDALRATAGTSRRGGLLRATPSVRLSSPFRGLSQHPRTVPDPRRDPRQTMLPPMGFLAPRHMPERRSVSAGLPTLRRAARGLGTSIATSTTVPPRAFRPPSVHGLHPSRRSPRVGRTPSREPLPSCRCPRRFASPPRVRADTVGFRASIPATSSFCPSRPCEHDASMPSWVSSLQSVLPLRPRVRFQFAPGPSSRVGRERRPDPPASRGVAERRDRLVPLGTAGSPGILHLATVAAPLGSCGGRAYGFASRLAACTRHEPIHALSRSTRAGR